MVATGDGRHGNNHVFLPAPKPDQSPGPAINLFSVFMRFFCIFLLVLFLTVRPAHAAADSTVWLAPDAMGEFYQRNNGRLAWNDAQNYADLLGALQGLAKHGLNPAHYHLAALNRYSHDLRKRDRLATDAWFSAAAHMIYGKLDSKSVEPDWTAAGRDADLQALLQTALAQNGVGFSLDLLAPRQPGYWSLVGALAKTRARAHIPMTRIPKGAWLRLGDATDRVKTLQKRLAELGLLEETQISGAFDGDTDRALRLFQTRGGLVPDGVAGPQTLRALNRTPAQEINQIRVNLERWRWLPDRLGRRHIRVNIADFHLTAWQDGAAVRNDPIIVGMLYRQTPVFSDRVEYIVFNPWWETPVKLAQQDKLPLFRKDPDAVKRLGYHLLDADNNPVDPDTVDWNEIPDGTFPFRLRQAPGPLNALGRVKIMFPNAHSVYIHDTPAQELFEENQRIFSSGCIRAKNVLKLAQWLLQDDPEWTAEKIAETVESGKVTQVYLKSPVPVYIIYMTAFVENYGVVRFVNDIYERDAAVLTGLNAAPAQTSTGPM